MNKNEVIITRLIAYLRGEMDPGQREEIERLLATSPVLREKFTLLGELLKSTEESGSGEVEGYVRELSDRLFDDFKKRKKRSRTARGVKIFDSRMISLPEGVRPAAVDTRRVKYRAGDIRLELALYPVTPDSYEIIGQLDGDNLNGTFEVTLKSGRRKFTTTTDKFFLFRFARVPVENYQLQLDNNSSGKASFAIEL